MALLTFGFNVTNCIFCDNGKAVVGDLLELTLDSVKYPSFTNPLQVEIAGISGIIQVQDPNDHTKTVDGRRYTVQVDESEMPAGVKFISECDIDKVTCRTCCDIHDEEIAALKAKDIELAATIDAIVGGDPVGSAIVSGSVAAWTGDATLVRTDEATVSIPIATEGSYKVIRDWAALLAAASPTTPETLVIVGEVAVDAALTLNENVTLDLRRGALNLSPGHALAIAGPVVAGEYDYVFRNIQYPGQVGGIMGGATRWVEWFGARVDAADSTMGLKAAAFSGLRDGNGYNTHTMRVHLHGGLYLTAAPVDIRSQRVMLIGNGSIGTRIQAIDGGITVGSYTDGFSIAAGNNATPNSPCDEFTETRGVIHMGSMILGTAQSFDSGLKDITIEPQNFAPSGIVMEGSCEEGCLLEGVTIRQHYWHYGIGGSRQVILNGFQAKRLNILSPQAGATDAVGLKLVGATWSLESATIRGIAGQTRLALLSGRNVIGKNIHIEDADCGIEISQNFFGNLTGTAGGGEWPTITLEGIDAIFLPGPAVRISHPGAFVTLTNVTIRGSAPLAETVDDVDRGKISQGINAGGHEVTPFYSRPGSGGTIITNDPALV